MKIVATLEKQKGEIIEEIIVLITTLEKYEVEVIARKKEIQEVIVLNLNVIQLYILADLIIMLQSEN